MHYHYITNHHLIFRYSVPKGSKSDPTETRANAFNAYVSFHFTTINDTEVAIVQQKLTHTGHSLENAEEAVMNALDCQLLSYICSVFYPR